MSKQSLREGLPFSAVVGMDLAKKALMCAAVDDRIKGVLIRGPSGTAKSVLVRSFSNLVQGKKMVEVPQNISDEQLFGGLDLEKAIKEGRTVVLGGLLKRADGNMLYVDNINLFDQRTVSALMECVLSGEVIVEREGVSAEYPLSTTVMATMDPAEKEISGAISDRFDICVSVFPEKEIGVRADITSVELGFREDPSVFSSDYDEHDVAEANRIKTARSTISGIVLTHGDLTTIARICEELGVKGHRGDIAVARVSKVLAALDARASVSDNDIREASIMCLSHRRTDREVEDQVEAENVLELDDVDVMELVETDVNVEDIDESSIVVRDLEPKTTVPIGNSTDLCDDIKKTIDQIVEFEAIRLHEMVGIKTKRVDRSSKKNSGRYQGFRIPNGKTGDPAFDATVRAAAPHQKARESNGLSLVIESQDIREKVRIKRDSCSFLFMVDVSGSLVVGNMMAVVQGAIRSMLTDSYVKRDKVALMTFRSDRADLIVPFTRSVETICETLANTPTGDSTPLNLALLTARDYLMNYLRKHPDERCYVIIITDGQGNVSAVPGMEPISELKKIAPIMNLPNTEWTVIDSSDGLWKKDALKLAKWLNARYIKLGDLVEY
ncbi:MAG: VWA domain-containing protein [Candidatus Methanogranum gryphiswaldense]|nr:MAG: VWA domain-containing protein [Candidatus Methanogranum sp. U3.2.1]